MVLLRVCGIIDTEKSVSVILATVRLIPSIVIEPFSIMYLNISEPVPILYQTALSSLFTLIIVPVPSICPDTIWPPNLPSTDMALSKFTLVPDEILAKDDLSRVSCITSTENSFGVYWVTVRHTPLTAIESPNFTSDNILSALIVKTDDFCPLLTFFTVPISSTIPVNTFLHLPLTEYHLLFSEIWYLPMYTPGLVGPHQFPLQDFWRHFHQIFLVIYKFEPYQQYLLPRLNS